MTIFFTLLFKLIPLYLLILLGYIAGRNLKAQKETISALLIYIISPVVIFYGVYTTDINLSIILVPVVLLATCCLMALLFYWIGKRMWKDATANLLALGSGFGNIGYFGIPLVLILYGEELLGIAIFALLASIIYQYTLGYYITARANSSGMKSLKKVIKLPSIYAMIVGVILNLLKVDIPRALIDIINNFMGAYVVLGMMIIGIGLAGLSRCSFDKRYLTMAFIAKFLAWPLVIWGVVWIDANYLLLLTSQIHQIFVVFAIVPMAANTVSIATELNTYPEKASLAVFLSTLFALFYIPFILFLI
jgi:malate permease and related proteins